jgi:hypothetical protein
MSQALVRVEGDERCGMASGIELSISCNDCVRRGTPDCADCLVSFVIGEKPDELVMTTRDADVVQLFTAQGMMPRLKFQHRSNTDS